MSDQWVQNRSSDGRCRLLISQYSVRNQYRFPWEGHSISSPVILLSNSPSKISRTIPDVDHGATIMARINNPMDFDTLGIGTALKRNRLVVPLNQREYSWEERHVEELFQDIAGAINSRKQAYFLGTLVLTNADDGTLEIADGQQRLATTSILLAAFRDYFYQRHDDSMVSDLESFLYTFVRRTREIDPRLHLNVTDHDYFRRRVLARPDNPERLESSPSAVSHTLIDGAAVLAASHVENILRPFGETTKDDHLNTWIEFVENSVQVIMLTVPDDMNAYVMFETLNDRGLRVSQSDLVKNYLFSEADSRISEAQERWASMNGTLEVMDDDEVTINYLRHLLISICGHVREKDVLERVRDNVRGRAPAIEFLGNLSSAALDYVAIQTPTHPKWSGNARSMRQLVNSLLLLRITPLRPLMLAVVRNFPVSEVATAFRRFESWSVRWLVAGGARSGRTESGLAEAAKRITEGNIKSADALAEHLGPILPNDRTFELAFANATVANHRLARYYLRSLESASRNEPEPEFVPNEDTVITLEHVLPQNPGENWPNVEPAVHSTYYRRLGNMALLPETPNRDIGNDAFVDKKPIYKSSSYNLTKEIADETQWGSIEIENRQQRMAKLAIKSWPLR